MSSTYHVLTSRLTSAATINGFLDGAKAGAEVAFPSVLANPAPTARVGSSDESAYWFNGPIQRISVYSSALSDSDILSVTNAIKDGP